MTKAKRLKLRRHILRLLEKDTNIGFHIKEDIEKSISECGDAFFRNPKKFMYESVLLSFACAIESGYFIVRKRD